MSRVTGTCRPRFLYSFVPTSALEATRGGITGKRSLGAPSWNEITLSREVIFFCVLVLLLCHFSTLRARHWQETHLILVCVSYQPTAAICCMTAYSWHTKERGRASVWGVWESGSPAFKHSSPHTTARIGSAVHRSFPLHVFSASPKGDSKHFSCSQRPSYVHLSVRVMTLSICLVFSEHVAHSHNHTGVILALHAYVPMRWSQLLWCSQYSNQPMAMSVRFTIYDATDFGYMALLVARRVRNS